MKKNLTFEEAMAELETTVARLEGGALSLDESLVQFESAVKLIKYCNDKISEAEQKVKILVEGSDGEVIDKNFIASENEN